LFSYHYVAGGSDLSGLKAIQWGIQNEPDAIHEFELLNGTVSNCGLFLHRCGFLGASPDGIVGQDTILEIKCPYKARDKSLDDLIASDKSFYLGYDKAYYLKKDHDYYHQVQGQLHICNKSICHFFVWSPSNSILINIYKDPEWASDIDKLQSFYATNMRQIALK